MAYCMLGGGGGPGRPQTQKSEQRKVRKKRMDILHCALRQLCCKDDIPVQLSTDITVTLQVSTQLMSVFEKKHF